MEVGILYLHVDGDIQLGLRPMLPLNGSPQSVHVSGERTLGPSAVQDSKHNRAGEVLGMVEAADNGLCVGVESAVGFKRVHEC